MTAIEIENLTKRYGEVVANDSLSFAVEEGEVFGYLGPNGAGKTTTIRTAMGFQSPTDGTIRVLGHDVRDERELIEAKRRVGYLPEGPAFDETLTGTELLDLHAKVKGGDRRDELLDLFDPPIERKIRGYSSGNVQKLGLVQAFMHDPDLVILDEPTSGLDPLMVQRFNEFIRGERRRGKTVFMSSHVLSEVRRVCDRVGIIRDARLVTTERVEALLTRSGKFVRLRAREEIPREGLLRDGVHNLAHQITDDGGVMTEATFTYTGDINPLLDRLAGYDLLDVDLQEAPLEEVFMRFYGGEADA